MNAKQLREAFEDLGLPAPTLHIPRAGFRRREWQGSVYYDWRCNPPIKIGDGIVADGKLHRVTKVDGESGRMEETSAAAFIFLAWADKHLPTHPRGLKVLLENLRAVLAGHRLVDTIQSFNQTHERQDETLEQGQQEDRRQEAAP